MEPRLRSEIIVQAAIRRASQRGTPATVVRRGDPDAGTIYVKLHLGFGVGSVVLAPARDYDTGRAYWRRATGPDPVPEPEADTTLAREARIDPDLWILEIEDRDGWNPFEDATWP